MMLGKREDMDTAGVKEKPQEKAYMTRDAIFAIEDIEYEDLVIPEWKNQVVRIRTLTGTQRDDWDRSIVEFAKKKRGRSREATIKENLRARLIALAVVDGNGKPLFTPKDVQRIGRKSAKALDRIFDRASEMSGIGEDDIELLTKNLEADQSDDSNSA